jgi:hypothetical protein
MKHFITIATLALSPVLAHAQNGNIYMLQSQVRQQAPEIESTRQGRDGSGWVIDHDMMMN